MTREGTCFLLSPNCAGREALRGPVPVHCRHMRTGWGSEPVGKLSVSCRPRLGPGRRHTKLPDFGGGTHGRRTLSFQEGGRRLISQEEASGRRRRHHRLSEGYTHETGLGNAQGTTVRPPPNSRGGGRDIRREAGPPAAF